MAVDVHAGLQWLAEKQGDAFSAGQHKSDLKIMAQRAMAEAPQAAVMWMKKLDQARAGVLTYSRVAIGEEVGRQLREEGNTEAAATCEEYVSKWKKFAEDAKRAADTAPEATAASQ
jgi:predicted urease superfamily metal-dependent hydrolase